MGVFPQKKKHKSSILVLKVTFIFTPYRNKVNEDSRQQAASCDWEVGYEQLINFNQLDLSLSNK